MADADGLGRGRARPPVRWANASDRRLWRAAADVIGASADYREAHPEDAVWAIRPRLDRLPASVLEATRIAVFAEDDAVGALAAADLAEVAARPVVIVQGGM